MTIESKCTESALRTILESITTFGSWSRASKQAGVGESTCYRWLTQSKAQMRAGDKSPPLYFTFEDRTDFFHRFAIAAKDRNVFGQLHIAIEQNRCGIEREIRSPVDGRRVPKLSAEFLGVSDQAMSDQFLDPVRDRWEWRCDPETGERIEPIWETEWQNVPASLRSKFFAGLLPGQFGERVEHNITQRTSVVVLSPPVILPRAAPLEIGELKTQPSLDDLRAQWKAQELAKANEWLANPARRTKNELPTPEIFGRPEPLPDRENVYPVAPASASASAPRAPSQPQASEMAPKPYARSARSDGRPQGYPRPGIDHCSSSEDRRQRTTKR